MKYYILIFSLLLSAPSPGAEPVPEDLKGSWSLNLESGEPTWMRITEVDGKPHVKLRVYIGPDGPYNNAAMVNGRLKFSRDRKMKKGNITTTTAVDVGIVDGKLDGVIVRSKDDGSLESRVRFTGTKAPEVPANAPDLSKVRFGHPISLFNGKDLTGWRPYEDDKTMGWSAEDGMLVNTTTKTDFSPTGSYANLRTEAEFEDFWLHIEFLVEANRNSGIYLRGMYEAQVVDRDSPMQGISGIGAIFSRIEPTKDAAKPPGEWQIYDITLVDQHVTVVLNGEKVIDNQPVVGPTGGAIYTNPGAPGPIYLQGDHTSVKFRDIYLAPVIED